MPFYNGEYYDPILYKIARDKNGCQLFKCTIEWVDTDGKTNSLELDDVDVAETTIGLLSGNICLADLEP